MRKVNVDVFTSGNKINGRQGLAWVFRSGMTKTVKCDLDKKQEYNDYREYDRIKVYDERRDLNSVGTVFRNTCHGKEEWEVAGYGCCLSADFGFKDAMEMADEANLPVAKKDDIVAIVEFSKEEQTFWCKLFKLGRVDIFCSTMATLIPLTDEEMKDVEKMVVEWVRNKLR